MKREAVASFLLVVLFLVSMFPLSTLSGAADSHGSPGLLGSQSIPDPVDEWPMFHHDLNHAGYSTSPAPTTNQTLWNYTTGGFVDSSPAVAAGIVYVSSGDDNVYALNALTGAQVWNYTTGSGVSSSPAVADGVVYVGSFDYKVYALNATTGAQVWNCATGSYVESSPAVADGVVYVGSQDGNVYALNATTGTRVWSYATGYSVFSSPAVAGGTVYLGVGAMDGKIYALNATTGAQIWTYTLAWNPKTGSIIYSSPAVASGLVFVASDNGKLYCLNAADGSLVWSYTTGGGYSSPAIANGMLYVGSFDNKTYALNATMGALIWNYTTGNYVASSPAVADGVVYVGSDDDKVYALNATTGAQVWSYTTGNHVWSSPAVADGIVYVGSDDGKVYAFGKGPLSASISPSSSTLDVGQSQLFTSSAANGTPPYAYQWYLGGAPVPGATGSSWTFTANSSGSYEIYVQVTDNAGFIANSDIANVTVNPALILSVAISPSSVIMEVNQSQLFTSTVSGGTSPYSYQWYLNGSPVSGATSATWNFTLTYSGYCRVYLEVTDAASAVATSNTSSVNSPNGYVIVDPDLSLFTTPSMVVGSTFNVNISLANVTNVEGVQFKLTWDPTLLNCTRMTEVLFHTVTPPDSWANIWSIGMELNNTAGNAFYAQTFYDNGYAVSAGYAPINVTTKTFPPDGKEACATFTMKVLRLPMMIDGNLTCAFHLSRVILGDVNASAIGAGVRDGTYTIISPSHDVGVTSAVSDKTVVGQGFSANVTVTVVNQGNNTETINITAYANATTIGSENITLSAGSSTTVMFTWNSSRFDYGNYTVSAYALPVPGETNTADNNLTGGTVEVTIPGDINGDGAVNILDSIKVSNAFLATPHSPNWNPNADINGDGVVNILDSIILANHFLQRVH
jgi:outer membrane protein assembly factor BamB